MFGTDYPFINPDTWLKEFRELKLKPEIEKKILGENARKFLGL
jgi:predicted TIM-barrel fold metal-dependent hydrolase